MNEIPEFNIAAEARFRAIRRWRESGPMARWILGCCLFVIPIDLLVVAGLVFAFPHEFSVLLFGFWLYAFPIACMILLSVTASFQTSLSQVPRLLAFAGLALIAAAINVSVYFAFTFWDHLGTI